MKYQIVIPKGIEPNPLGIAPGSAILSEKEEGGYCIHFEGNLYGAENLESFEGKIFQAACRKAGSYPTVAALHIPAKEFEDLFQIVGELDYTQANAALQTHKELKDCIQGACSWNKDLEANLKTWKTLKAS